ncbi:hypothetical protein HHI36_006224 [Cryptolaemus montrouzieri]|uniref:Uncharacterized protein n=1 Tax=Cryptolaemus montrouzieri TaxID=559131 RepID=A0ABD2NWV2_9CUCU
MELNVFSPPFENLSSEQWDIVEQLIILLKPFEEITKNTSSTYSSISDVIPHVTTLSRYLQKEQLKQQTPQVDDLRQSLQDNLNFRPYIDAQIIYYQLYWTRHTKLFFYD